MNNYRQEEVTFKNVASNITLAGTLTMPQAAGPFPAVVLISGMGPSDRDSTVMGHKIFLTLADYLTRRGLAVLRYDKRGIGKSTGTFDMNLTSNDFADDVLAGIQYLKTRKEINSKKIGLIGHSEGGMIAPMVAVKSKDVAFIVLMAGANAASIDSILDHVGLQLRADGASDALIAADRVMRKQALAIVKQEPDFGLAKKRLHEVVENYLQELPETQKAEFEKFIFAIPPSPAITPSNKDETIDMFNSPWFRYFLTHDSVDVLRQIKIPVLAINGNLDFIIACSHIVLPIIAQALKEAGNTDYVTIELPNVNHWLQTCKTGAIAEYGASKETLAPLALKTITDWIVAHTAHK